MVAQVQAPQTRPNRCPSCTAGKVEEWVAGHVSGSKPCDVCGGTGAKPAPQPRRIAA